MGLGLVDLEELDIEAERIVRWYIRRATTGTVSTVGDDVEGSLLAESHLLDAFVPAADNFADAKSEGEAFALIEHLAGSKIALVLHGDMAAVFRLGSTLRSGSSDDTNNTTRSLSSSLKVLADNLMLGPVSLLMFGIAIENTMAANTTVLSVK